jgi:hypothetical protein
MSEEYSGWKNRETWAVNLWSENDQVTYSQRNAYLLSVYREYTHEPMHKLINVLADAYQEFIEELLDGAVDDNYKIMRNDIGSLYRVDYNELARYWVESVLELDTN